MSTETSSFGVSKREGHDSSAYYNRRMTSNFWEQAPPRLPEFPHPSEWANKLYTLEGTDFPVPDESIALTFTSPPYNVGKDYDADLTLEEHIEFLGEFFNATYQKTIPGGRCAINIANLGRKPYLPITSFVYPMMELIGWLPMGEIIWRKGKGASGNVAWGSWMNASAPSLRDVHEYILIFAKEQFKRWDRGNSDISREEFLAGTLSVWDIPPVSAKKIGHPAPFPVSLAKRIIELYTYVGDVVFDPFVGSGTTCLAAKELGRYYIGIDNVAEYIELATKRLTEIEKSGKI